MKTKFGCHKDVQKDLEHISNTDKKQLRTEVQKNNTKIQAGRTDQQTREVR